VRRWYKDILSDYTKEQDSLHEYDTKDKQVIDRKTNDEKVVHVPILKPGNFGERMAIDDKGIGGEGYTIISNKETGKIAALMSTTKSKIINEILGNVDQPIRDKVKSVSRDLAEGYKNVSNNSFPKAYHVADKFHIIQAANDAVQDVRVKNRKEVLRKIREKEIDKRQKFENGETLKELLARGRYQLFKFKKQWTETQEKRAEILFKEFPEIKKVYSQITRFRNIYKIKIGNKDKARISLKKWYRQSIQLNIEELNNFVCLVKNHEEEVLNYFDEGETNAYAESLNSRIQSFVNSNCGTRDIDFFHFRLMVYFA